MKTVASLSLPLAFALVLLTTISAKAAPPAVIDNNDPGYADSGYTPQSHAPAFNSNTAWANPATAYADFTFNGLDAGEQYRIFATWDQDGQANLSTAVPYTLSDGGGLVSVNQRANTGPANDYLLADTDAANTLHYRFQYLGTVTEDGDGSVNVRINGPGTDFAFADAVVVAEVPTNITVIDNGDATGYSQTGFTSQPHVDSFGSDTAFNSTPDNGASATWTFENVDPGEYAIYATWDQTGQSNLTTAAPFTLSDGGGLVTVDQTQAPLMDLIATDTDGTDLTYFNFQKLGDVEILDGEFVVQLDAVAGGGTSDFVFADAIAIVQTSAAVPEPASVAIWSLLGLAGMGFVLWRRKNSRV